MHAASTVRYISKLNTEKVTISLLRIICTCMVVVVRGCGAISITYYLSALAYGAMHAIQYA